jgi:CBS domain-containing protein
MQGLDFAAVTLALFNAFLVFVSLIPGYPMDGGQLVHAIAWRRSGDPLKANETVSRIGRFVGYALLVIGAGLAVVFDLLPGLGLMIAGWVLLSSSRMLDRRGVLQSLISGLRVIDAADPGSARVPPQLTLDVFAPEYMGERLGAAALVESGGELLGLISQAQIRRVPKRSWPTTRTDQAMVPIADVPRANPDDDLWPVLETLERSGQDAVLIGSGEPHVVLMTRRSAAMLIHARSQGQQRTQKPTAGLLGLGKRRPPVAPLQPPPPLPPSVPATKADETGHHADAQRTPDQHTDEEERR